MTGNAACTVYIGNLDEKVPDRVLYEILIQVGRLVDLHMPRDKETNRPKGYAFAEYETEEIAEYAVRLFSGLVTLYNKTLKFGISGQDKAPWNISPAVMPTMCSPRPRPHNVPFSYMENQTSCLMSSYSSSEYSANLPSYEAEPPPPGVEPSNGSRFDFGPPNHRHTTGGLSFSSLRNDART